MNVTTALLARGYSAEEIEKIWGGNFVRVFRETGMLATVQPPW
jgi:membrane dipeptidase